MAKNYYGSICLTDLLNKAKEKHEAFAKSEKNGKIYVKVNIWVHDEPDKYDNVAAIQVPAKEKDNRFYIGNLKESEYKEPEITDDDVDDLPEPNDLPF
jgi:hypothetical protein